MLKVALSENDMHLPTITKLFPNANWYERETWEMFGMTFDGHPPDAHHDAADLDRPPAA
jgi:NADH-quinone oxidoreductase subunit C/D